MPTQKVMIAAGGTGGHIYPGLACAEYFVKHHVKVVWAGAKGGMEERVVTQAGIPLQLLSIKGVRGKGIGGLLLAPFRILHSMLQMWRILKREKPQLLLGMGGYVTVPAGLCARLLNIPLIIHEQNAVAGTANTLLNRLGAFTLQAHENTLPGARTVGNPIRMSLLVKIKQAMEKKTVTENKSDTLKVLVLGGSLGARAINDIIPAVLSGWQETMALEIWHQTGKQHFAAVHAQYKKNKLQARMTDYMNNMGEAYAWADIVVCRAGAMTVSELAIAGKPAIFIPYPYAIDDHQTQNARQLVDCGGAFLLPQSELNQKTLTDLLLLLANDPERRRDMGAKAMSIAMPYATQNLVKLCLERIRQ